jgi:hypothetical protein
MALVAAALLLAAGPGFAAHGQAVENPGQTSGLIEQVGSLPLNAVPGGQNQAGPPPAKPQPDLRPGRALGPAIHPLRRPPELTRQRQLGEPGGPGSDRSVILDQDAVTPRQPGAGVAVAEPRHRPADRTQAKPLDATVEHQKSQTKGLVTQPGQKLVGSAKDTLSKPEPEFTPPENQVPAPEKEVTPPKSGADTAGRPVAIECHNRQTTPGQPEAHLTPPDRCSTPESSAANPDLASQRLGQDTASSPPKFSGDAAAIGLVPGTTTPNTIGAGNPFLLPAGPTAGGGVLTPNALPPTLGGGGTAGGR